MQSALGYIRWENFDTAIKRAKTSCESADVTVTDHFRDVTKMVDIGSNITRKINDLKLTRYKPGKVTIPNHGKRDLSPGVAKSILKQAGLK